MGPPLIEFWLIRFPGEKHRGDGSALSPEPRRHAAAWDRISHVLSGPSNGFKRAIKALSENEDQKIK
jgi:hypothetical protein